MSDNESKTEFTLDLDAKEMIHGLMSVKEHIAEIGETKNLAGLTEGLLEVSKLVGVVGVAFLALKTTVDAVFEAEHIRQINLQFEAMAANAGIVGDELKEGLVGAAKGLVDDTEILQAANKAMVEMGESAEKLPQIMELARKATAVFGGDLVSNFETINQAIANGQTRMLKHLGLNIDVKKANEEYAASLGITASQLSETDKKQALLNAVLEKGKKSFKDVNESVLEANNTWKMFKTTMSQVGETITLAIEKTAGPTIRSFLKDLTTAAIEFRDSITAKFGEGSEKIVATSKVLEREFTQLTNKLNELDKSGQTFFNGSWVTKGSKLADIAAEQMRARMEEIRKELDKTNASIKKAHEEQKAIVDGKSEGRPDAEHGDQKKIAQDKAKFEQDMVRMHQEALQSQIAATHSWAEKERLALEQVAVEAQKYAAKKQQISSDEHLNSKQKHSLLLAEEEAYQARLTELEVKRSQEKQMHLQEQMRMTQDSAMFERMIEEQKDQARVMRDQQLLLIEQNKALSDQDKRNQSLQIEQEYQAQITQIQMNAYQEREAMLQRWVYSSNNAAEQFARGFASASQKAANDLANFGKQGQMVFGMLTNHVSNAFMQMGEGSKKGSQVMREAMFGLIADIAQYYGQMMIATSIFPPNPPVFAAGAGLLVLAGYLRSQARGKSGGMSFSGGGSGMGDIGGVPSTFSSAEQLKQNTKDAKAVHLEVHGNIFDTESTRQRITELVRQSVDSTDFSITRVGGGI
jgi:hypothetical protein